MLTDARLIRRSLVMPFRFTTALEALQSANLPNAGVVLSALSAAVDVSLDNVPAFTGRTLVALDGSGSMMGRPIKIGALFAATLAKANVGADVMLFSDVAQYVSLNRRDSTLTLAGQLERGCRAAGTNFHAVFQTAARAYDRIIILSDMQAWMGAHVPTASFAKYKQSHRCECHQFRGQHIDTHLRSLPSRIVQRVNLEVTVNARDIDDQPLTAFVDLGPLGTHADSVGHHKTAQKPDPETADGAHR